MAARRSCRHHLRGGRPTLPEIPHGCAAARRGSRSHSNITARRRPRRRRTRPNLPRKWVLLGAPVGILRGRVAELPAGRAAASRRRRATRAATRSRARRCATTPPRRSTTTARSATPRWSRSSSTTRTPPRNSPRSPPTSSARSPARRDPRAARSDGRRPAVPLGGRHPAGVDGLLLYLDAVGGEHARDGGEGGLRLRRRRLQRRVGARFARLPLPPGGGVPPDALELLPVRRDAVPPRTSTTSGSSRSSSASCGRSTAAPTGATGEFVWVGLC